MTFNVEAFIKERVVYSSDVSIHDDYLSVEDARDLVARLVPPGHVVAPEDQLKGLKHIAAYVGLAAVNTPLVPVYLIMADAMRDIPDAPLPASSGPEQTKCETCGATRPEDCAAHHAGDSVGCWQNPEGRPPGAIYNDEFEENSRGIPEDSSDYDERPDCAKDRAEPKPDPDCKTCFGTGNFLISGRGEQRFPCACVVGLDASLAAQKKPAEPKCGCGLPSHPGICGHNFTGSGKYCDSRIGNEPCGYPRGCHTPAPAAKEVNNGR